MDLKQDVKTPGDTTVLCSCSMTNTAWLVITKTLKITEQNEWLCKVKGGWYEIVCVNDYPVAVV